MGGRILRTGCGVVRAHASIAKDAVSEASLANVQTVGDFSQCALGGDARADDADARAAEDAGRGGGGRGWRRKVAGRTWWRRWRAAGRGGVDAAVYTAHARPNAKAAESICAVAAWLPEREGAEGAASGGEVRRPEGV